MLVAAVPLAFVVTYLIQKGAVIVDWKFLTDDIPVGSRLPGPGMGPAVLGTLLTTGAATAPGVVAAVYLNEYGGTRRPASVIASSPT